VIRLLFAILTFLSVEVAPADATMTKHRFSNCETLCDYLEFISWVARDSKSVGMTGARVNAQVYAANRTPDPDGDGVASELLYTDQKVGSSSLPESVQNGQVGGRDSFEYISEITNSMIVRSTTIREVLLLWLHQRLRSRDSSC
jgi:hypothetical protein